MGQIVKRIITAFTVCMFMIFGFLSPASAINYSVTQMSNNDGLDDTVRISSNGDMVWVGPGNGGYKEIYVYDEATKSTRKLTNNVTHDDSPEINAHGDIAWRTYDTTDLDYVIMLYTKATNTIQRVSLPKDPNFRHNDANPQINNLGQVVYQSQNLGADYEIMFYNGATVIQITNDNLTDEFPVLNDNGDIAWMKSTVDTSISDIYLRDGASGVITPLSVTSVNEMNPRINQIGDIVWDGFNTTTSSYQIYYYKKSNGSTTRVSTLSGDNMLAEINANGQFTWGGQVTATNMDVFFRNGLAGTPINLSNNSNDDSTPMINDNGWVTWFRDTGNTGTNAQILVWDGTMVNSTTPTPPTQLTNDSYDHINPVLNNWNELAWLATGGTGTVTDYDVFSAITGTCATLNCNDNNLCTTDSCNLVTGTCVYTSINCNDNNTCTTDTCNPSTGCVHTQIICNDNNPCTSDSCNQTSGCVYTPITSCTDFNACTTDSCDPARGGCVYTPLPGIDDHNACTTDYCNPAIGSSSITHTPIVCNDNNICTTDTCDTATGCVFSSRCNDNNPCTIDTCNPSTGACSYPAVDCNDYNVCTTDTCNTTTGQCVHANNETLCPSSTGNNFTMLDTNNNAVGGTNDIVFSWDGTRKTSVAVSGQISNALLLSPCPYGAGLWSAHDLAVYGPGTYTVYTGCPAGSPGCGTGTSMIFTVRTGEIGIHMLFDWGSNPNIDVVNVYTPNAVFDPKSPMWTQPCGTTPATCQPWTWSSYDWDADGWNGGRMVDGPFPGFQPNFNLIKTGTINPCCDAAIRCNDNDACTTDTCIPATGACSHTAVVCNDNNACTTDTCNPATGCVYTPKVCNDNNACTIDTCNTTTGNCVFTPKVCDDNNACTTNNCNTTTGACFYTPFACNDNNACTTDACNTATGCVYTPIVCNDNNACTIDSCNAGTCVYTSRVCVSPGAVCNSAVGCIPSGGVNTKGNNLSILQTNGLVLGGTNDVNFTWDGTVQNAATFANGNGPSNATISSDEPYNYWLWKAKRVQVVGPGTYWVDLDGAEPGTSRYEVTIPAYKIGAHMLLDWGDTGQATSCGKLNCDVDVWVAWDFNKAFAAGELYTGADDGANTNAPAYDEPYPMPFVIDGRPNTNAKVWDLVSVDLAGRITNSSGTTLVNLPLNGIPGIPMREGANISASVNFNVMEEDRCADAATRCTDHDACTQDICDPATGNCSHTTITCNDSSICTTDTCNSAIGCVYTPKNCNDNNACTTDWCHPTTGACLHTQIVCNDNIICTTDTCNPATGCVFTNNTNACSDNNACTVNDHCSGGVCISGTTKVCPIGVCNSATGCPVTSVNTGGNNMTLLMANGFLLGGTNDVKFTWDGTRQNAATFANGNGPSNATLSSDEPYNYWLWKAKRVQVVGPGTYWVDLDGVGPLTTRYEVTIPDGRIGAHMLFDWGDTGQATSCGKLNCDVDVWVAWDFNNAFATGKLFTGADDGTHTYAPADDEPYPQPFVIDGRPNASTKVWDLVSTDVAGRVTTSTGGTLKFLLLDEVPGIKLQEGYFGPSNLNFNVMLQ